jgi:dTDP-4-dehydrorhamnose reductase
MSIFCPLLVNDLANLLLEMLTRNLKGLFHVVSSQCVSKYEFGISLARQFGFEDKLIRPSYYEQSNLLARRSPLLTLRVDKLVAEMKKSPPDIHAGMKRFFELHQSGYPNSLREMIDLEWS